MIDKESKRKFYNAATQNILRQINELNLPADKHREAIKWAKVFRAVFQLDELKQAVFVSKKGDIWDLGYDSAGFCRVASITFSIIMDFHDWEVMVIDKEQWNGGSGHHYLKHVPTGKFIDLTYDQFAIDGFTVPYDIGYHATWGLSKKDETRKFADAIGIDIEKVLRATKGR